MNKIFIGLVFSFALNAFALQEREIVAAVLIAEAGGEPVAGMREVAGVIQNRARFSGKTQTQVVTKPLQFSCLNGKSVLALVQQARKHPKFGAALEIAGQKQKTDATHYYNPKLASPSWARSLKVTKRIGNHVFLK